MSKKEQSWLFVWLVTVILAMSSVTSAQERWREEREERREGNQERWWDQRKGREGLVGRWYKDGAPCEIVPTRDGFEARNENGDTSKLVYDRDGDVRALDWEGGLRGEIRGNRILWANGTSWSRGSPGH